jgi:hypothetical protein
MKFKKGDMVRCKSGFLQGGPKDHKELAGGSGYKAGRIFIVNTPLERECNKIKKEIGL